MRNLTPAFSHTDSRGILTTIFNDGKWPEVNYLESRANIVRGGHYHQRTEEMVFIIEGQVEVIIENINTRAKHTCVLGKGETLIIEPLESHTFRTLTYCRWLNFLSHPYDHAKPDVHTLAPNAEH
jgi:dTDP-4-dehydrorhamnose 3,5-epimerase-like enzyme